ADRVYALAQDRADRPPEPLLSLVEELPYLVAPVIDLARPGPARREVDVRRHQPQQSVDVALIERLEPGADRLGIVIHGRAVLQHGRRALEPDPGRGEARAVGF